MDEKVERMNTVAEADADKIKRMQDIPVPAETVKDLLKSSPTVDFYNEKIVIILEIQAMFYNAVRGEAKRGELLIDWDILYDKELFSKYYDLNTVRVDKYDNFWFSVRKELKRKNKEISK